MLVAGAVLVSVSAFHHTPLVRRQSSSHAKAATLDCQGRRAVAPVMMPITKLQEEVQLLRAELVRKDAIIKSLLSTLEQTAITTEGSGIAPSSTPLQDLCQISKEACDAVTPMLRAFYEKISDQRHGGSSKLKSDATYFTIADGIVQHMFISHLFAGNKVTARILSVSQTDDSWNLVVSVSDALNTSALPRPPRVQFAQIVGEEDESVINILEKPYSVDDLVVPYEFNSIIAATLNEIDQLATRIDPNLYKTMTVFIDQIDGTREFATAQGEYVTVLIGYNDGKRSRCVAVE